MEWMLDIQLGRRNLSPIQRIAVTEKYRPIYEKQAKKNIEEGGRKGGLITQNKPSSNLTNPLNSIDTNKKLADIAGVKPTTYKMGAKVLNSDNDELKQRVLSGETSISAGYKELIQRKKVLKDLIETNIRQRGIGNPIKLGRCIKELERIYGVRDGSTNKQGTIVGENFSFTQKDLANELGLDIRTMQNYKKLTELVPELQDWVETGILALIILKIDEDLQDEKSKLRALISNNFGRRKNDPAKDRKALETYVELKGYKNGEHGDKLCQNGTAKSTLDEIAKELNMSKRNLQRALRIERNLADSMKELLDTGEIIYCVVW